jgi:DNA-binding SARP family transcriptional activator
LESTLGIRVLGPLRLWSGRAAPTPSAPKERQLLGLLLMQHERVVPISVIIDELWFNQPPKSAITAIQTYVLNIRRQLAVALGLPAGEVRATLLRTQNKGYVFDTTECRYDLTEFHRLEAKGTAALHAGDQTAAVRLLRQADEIWRGAPLLDVDQGLPLQAEVARLEQARSNARARRVEAQLRIGHHHDVLAELAGLVIQHPFDEHLHGYYMIALQRVGRRQEALRVFHDLRKAMADELGMEPSSELWLLQRHILEASEPRLPEQATGPTLLHRVRIAAD